MYMFICVNMFVACFKRKKRDETAIKCSILFSFYHNITTVELLVIVNKSSSNLFSGIDVQVLYA
jgi:hypothetical protein